MPTITIGLTRSDREGPDATGYSGFTEGYLPGAGQDTFDVDVPDAGALDADALGWLVFKATNDPTAESQPGPVGDLARLIAPMRRAPLNRRWLRMRAFSTGDTITVDGVSLALGHGGFVPVEVVPADRALLAAGVERFWADRKSRS